MMNRRQWIRNIGLGVGGATLFGPLLTRIAQAQPAATPRFLFVVEGNGFEPVTLLSAATRAALDASNSRAIDSARWWHTTYRHNAPIILPAQGDDAPEADLQTATALANLGDLSTRTAVLYGLSSRITGGGHSAEHGALASARTTAGQAGGPTIDAWLARQPGVQQQTPFDAVRLGVRASLKKSVDFGTCAYAAGRSAPLLLQPEKAFQSLFGSVAGGVAADRFARRGTQLEFAAGDVRASLQAFGGNSVERVRLETYLESLEVLQARRERLIELGPQLEGVLPNIRGNANTPLRRFQQQLDLATAAFIGNLTNVAVVGCGTGGAFGIGYPEVIEGIGRHDLHHTSAAQRVRRNAIHEVTRIQVEAIAGVARQLAATPDIGGGTMLDHTVIVFIGDNGEQHHATASEFPILLMGGEGLGLQTGGRTVVYPGLNRGGHRQVSNLWNTLGHLAGVELNDFGTEGPTRVALGPLGELMA